MKPFDQVNADAVDDGMSQQSSSHHAERPELITTPPSLAGNLPRGWVAASSLADAEWMSLPRPRERDRYANLSRTTLIEMLDRGDIRGCVLRRPGATRGKRLVHLPSLRAHLAHLADEETVRRGAGKPVSVPSQKYTET